MTVVLDLDKTLIHSTVNEYQEDGYDFAFKLDGDQVSLNLNF
jgi:predicted HAD superfamily phosphohydrolase YqeG